MLNDCQPGITAALLLASIFCPYSGMRKNFFRGAKSMPSLFLLKRRLCWVYRQLTFVIISIGNSFTAITSSLRHRSSICSSRRAFFIRKKRHATVKRHVFLGSPHLLAGKHQLVVSDRITPTTSGKTKASFFCLDRIADHPNFCREDKSFIEIIEESPHLLGGNASLEINGTCITSAL